MSGDTIKEKFEAIYVEIVKFEEELGRIKYVIAGLEAASLFEICCTGFNPQPPTLPGTNLPLVFHHGKLSLYKDEELPGDEYRVLCEKGWARLKIINYIL